MTNLNILFSSILFPLLGEGKSRSSIKVKTLRKCNNSEKNKATKIFHSSFPSQESLLIEKLENKIFPFRIFIFHSLKKILE